MFGAIEDFEPVVQEIVAAGLKPPYDWDEYASYFFDKAEQLVRKGKSTENSEMASEMFMCVSSHSSSFSTPYPGTHLLKQGRVWPFPPPLDG